MLIRCLLSVILWLCPVTVLSADYYCDLTLSSDGSGTTSAPWQLSQAINDSNVSGGDTVYLRGAGGDLEFDTDTYTIGSAGSQVIYTQWVGQTTASLESVEWVGSGSSYVEFSSITIDPGETGTYKVAVRVDNSGANDIDGAEITFDNCIIYAHRYNGYTGGDYYPYYMRETGAGSSITHYGMEFRGGKNLTVEIKDSTHMHGYRHLRLYDNIDSAFLVEGGTFDRMGEDAIEVDTPNVTIRGCRFAETEPMSALYAEWYWPSTGSGTATGTWSGHEGETITQDNTGASGILTGVYDGKLYLLADDADNLPVRTDTDVWRLDSDPTNVYWTTGVIGDNAHNDCISTQTAQADSTIIEQCYFDGTYSEHSGQAVKVASGASATFRNNIITNWDSGAYALLIENADAVVVNNIILAVSSDYQAIRTLGGTHTIANNILSGAIHSSGTTTTSNNIFKIATDPWSGAGSLVSQDFSDSPSGNNRYFTSFTTGDFSTYDSDSPQVDAGSVTYAPENDYLGTNRPQGNADDIGAYEYYLTKYGVNIYQNGSGQIWFRTE